MKKWAMFFCLALLVFSTAIVFSACSPDVSEPKNLFVDKCEIAHWDSVPGAVSYNVCVNGVFYNTTQNQFDLFLITDETGDYEVEVGAVYKGGRTATASQYVVHSVEIVEESRFTFTLSSDKTCYYATVDPAASGKLIFPDEYEGLPVLPTGFRKAQIISAILPSTAVRGSFPRFSGCKQLVRVESVLPKGMATSLSSKGFSGCSSLVSVTVPDVVSIGDRCFSGCSSLKEFQLPATLQSLGVGVFVGCNSLERLDVDEANEYFSLVGTTILSKDGKKCFAGLPSTTSIPDSVEVIAESAFEGTAVRQVDLSSRLEEIGANAFRNSALSQVYFPANLKTIGALAFECCDELTEVTIPSNVEFIGDFAFCSCKNLQTVVLQEGAQLGVEKISFDIYDHHGVFFNCEKLNKIVLPSTLEDICGDSFNLCADDVDVQIDPRNTALRFVDGTIVNVNTGELLCGLRADSIPEGVTSIGEFAFLGSRDLCDLTIPTSVESVGDFAFYCTALRSLDLSRVKSIGRRAFQENFFLETVYFPTTVTQVDVAAFFVVDNASVTLSYPEGGDFAIFAVDGSMTFYGRYCEPYSDHGTATPYMRGCQLVEEDGYFYVDSFTSGYVENDEPVEWWQRNFGVADLVAPTRKGYEFGGWTTVEHGEVAEIVPKILVKQVTKTGTLNRSNGIFPPGETVEVICGLTVDDLLGYPSGTTFYAIWKKIA